MRQLLQTSIQPWNSAPSSSIRLSIGDAISTDAASMIAHPNIGSAVILCDSSFSTHIGDDPDFSPATTSITLDTAAGSRVQSAVIILNGETSKNASVDKFTSSQLALFIAHEIGHALGLGHTSDTSALMFYDLSSRKQLNLGQDDFDGIAFLYPRNEFFGNSATFGCGIFQNSELKTEKNHDSAHRFVEITLIVLVLLTVTKTISKWASDRV
jgi:hypothetical protein